MQLNFIVSSRLFWTYFIFCCTISLSLAQDAMRVERIRVIPEDVPILNIHVDEENIKWVANTRTLYKVDAKDHATEVPIGGGEMSLLQLPGGNHDIRWNKDDMARILGNAKVTTAAYDFQQKILWIGTDGYGIFKLKAEPTLRLVEQLHIDNSKLRSDFINSIYISKDNKIWIATEDGAVSVERDQWTNHQRYFNILRIRGRGNELWAIGDDLIWLIDKKDSWTPIPINRREIESEVHDISVDPEGRVWIASNVMTSYRIDSDRYQRFGPGQYFTSQFVNYVAIDDDATIWVGTNDKGLYIIEKESTITVTTTMDKYLDCNSTAPNAAISVRAIGGKPPYTFVWSNGTTQDRLTGLGPGKYQLTVTDATGSTKAATAEILDPYIQLTTSMDRQETDAGTSDGGASVKVTGGVPPYTYEWYSGFGEASLTGIPEGMYGVTVTDAAGCSATSTVTVTQKVYALSAVLEQKEFLRCHGSTSAVIVATQAGGKAPYQYAWSNGGPNVEFLEKLGSGKYTVTVTDALGNIATSAILISQPEALTATIHINSHANANMTNGNATVQSTGGKPPYQYLWDNGETASTALNLAPRRHGVTVTDASGCTTQAAVDIIENINPLNASITQTSEIVCAGDSTAGLVVYVKGGKTPYSYVWNVNYAWRGANPKGNEITGLPAGEYAVTITDASGGSASTKYSITAPRPIVATTIAETPAVAGTNEGHAIVRAEGGTGKLTYAWDNGDLGARTEALSAGKHNVTVTDEQGCTAVAIVEILENVLPLNAVITQIASIQCHGDHTAGIKVSVQGGKEPLNYQWSKPELKGNTLNGLQAGEYAVTITDAAGGSTSLKYNIKEPLPIKTTTLAESPALAGKNEGKASVRAEGGTGKFSYSWDNGDQTGKPQTLSAGKHNVTVTDEAGCSAVAAVEIQENILAMSLNLEQTNSIKCAGEKTGSIHATITGGKEPYAFTWSTGAQEKNDLGSLGAGTYKLTVADAAGNSISREMILKDPEPLIASVEVLAPASANQADGHLRVKPRGGTGDYQIRWNNNSTDAELSAVAAGNYQVTVTDENGCSAVASAEVTEDILPLRVNVTQLKSIDCAGQSEGALEVKVSGGKSPYSYQWNDNAESQSRSGLKAGEYSVEVTDAANQKMKASVVIEQPLPLTGEFIDVRPATHERMSDGKATARISGGMTPFKFAWDNNEPTARAVQLSVGMHTVNVTDANGCTLSLTVDVAQKILPELTAENLEKGEAVRMEKLQFDADSTSINDSSMPTLEELYNFMYDNPTIVVEIGGHTNSLPEHDYCDRLSEARAKAVADFIIDKGIESKRIVFKGYGKRQPVASNQTPEGRKKNQRVEVRIVKLSE